MKKLGVLLSGCFLPEARACAWAEIARLIIFCFVRIKLMVPISLVLGLMLAATAVQSQEK